MFELSSGGAVCLWLRCVSSRCEFLIDRAGRSTIARSCRRRAADGRSTKRLDISTFPTSQGGTCGNRDRPTAVRASASPEDADVHRRRHADTGRSRSARPPPCSGSSTACSSRGFPFPDPDHVLHVLESNPDVPAADPPGSPARLSGLARTRAKRSARSPRWTSGRDGHRRPGAGRRSSGMP